MSPRGPGEFEFLLVREALQFGESRFCSSTVATHLRSSSVESVLIVPIASRSIRLMRSHSCTDSRGRRGSPASAGPT